MFNHRLIILPTNANLTSSAQSISIITWEKPCFLANIASSIRVSASTIDLAWNSRKEILSQATTHGVASRDSSWIAPSIFSLIQFPCEPCLVQARRGVFCFKFIPWKLASKPLQKSCLLSKADDTTPLIVASFSWSSSTFAMYVEQVYSIFFLSHTNQSSTH